MIVRVKDNSSMTFKILPQKDLLKMIRTCIFNSLWNRIRCTEYVYDKIIEDRLMDFYNTRNKLKQDKTLSS